MPQHVETLHIGLIECSAIVEMHRYLSTLVYHPIESTSSCSPTPPPERLAPVFFREAPTHTAKILKAVERLTALLTLPVPISLHTPYSICVIASPTIAYLSACKHLLEGEELKLARERIRVAIGALEGFGDVWPRGKKVVREVKIIARELLGLPSGASREKTNDVMHGTTSEEASYTSDSPAISDDFLAALAAGNCSLLGADNDFGLSMQGAIFHDPDTGIMYGSSSLPQTSLPESSHAGTVRVSE